MKMIFPHIPKCAGSSIKSQLEGRKGVFLDYFNHPTWVYEPDRKLGSEKQEKLKNSIRKLDSWIVFGHFAPSAYYELPYNYQIILLRDPLERAVSHFHFLEQLIPDNDITRRRHKEVGLIKDNLMGIEEFFELDHIKYFYSKYYLNNLAIDERLIVVSMDDMESSYNRIMGITGLEFDHTVRINENNYNGSFDDVQNVFQVDTDLYNYLISLK